MNKTFSVLLSLLFLVGCTQGSKTASNDSPDVKDSSDFFVDVSKLSSTNLDLNLVREPILNLLDFGPATSYEISKVLTLKNTSASSKPVSVSLEGDGYTIKVNRCVGSLAPNASCQITVVFNSRSLYQGTHTGVLSVSDSPSDLSLNLISSILNKPDPNVSSGSLSVSISAPFYPAIAGQSLSRTLKVTNAGPGNVASIQTIIPSTYIIKSNRCGSLKVRASCTIELAYKDARRTVPLQSSTDQAMISGTTAASVSIMLSTGQPGGSSSGPAPVVTVQGSSFESNGITYGNGNDMYVQMDVSNELVNSGHIAQLRFGNCDDVYAGDPVGSAYNEELTSNQLNLSLQMDGSLNYSALVFTLDPQDPSVMGEITFCQSLGELWTDSTPPEILTAGVNLGTSNENQLFGPNAFTATSTAQDNLTGLDFRLLKIYDGSTVIGTGNSHSGTISVSNLAYPSVTKTLTFKLFVSDLIGNTSEQDFSVIYHP